MRAAFAVARRLGDAASLARAALVTGGVVGIDEVDPQQIRNLEEVLDALPPEDSPARVRVLGRLALELYFVPNSLERRQALCEEAVAMARRLGESLSLAWALGCRHNALWGPDNLEDRITDGLESLRLIEGSQEPLTVFWSRGWRWWILHDWLELGDLAAVEREIDAFVAWTEEPGMPFERWLTGLLRTMQALMAGHFAEAELLVEQWFAFGQQTYPTPAAEQKYAEQFSTICYQRGRLRDVEERIRSLAERNPTIPHWRCRLAWLHAMDGNKQEAQRLFDLLAADGFAGLHRDHYWIYDVALLAETCSALSDVGKAPVLYDLLFPYASRNVMPGSAGDCHGSAAHYLGLLATMLGWWSDAEHHFERALDFNARLQAPPFVARTRYAYAAMLVRRNEPGDRERALELVGQALATAEELGMTRLAEQALALKVEVQGILKA